MILIDANVPMYLVGGDHPNKVIALRMLERAVTNRERLVTDAEVFQEILHRYVAIGRRDAIQPAFDALNAAVFALLCVERPGEMVSYGIRAAFTRRAEWRAFVEGLAHPQWLLPVP